MDLAMISGPVEISIEYSKIEEILKSQHFFKVLFRVKVFGKSMFKN